MKHIVRLNKNRDYVNFKNGGTCNDDCGVMENCSTAQFENCTATHADVDLGDGCTAGYDWNTCPTQRDDGKPSED